MGYTQGEGRIDVAGDFPERHNAPYVIEHSAQYVTGWLQRVRCEAYLIHGQKIPWRVNDPFWTNHKGCWWNAREL